LVHVTVVPALTFRVPGVKAKLTILTLLPEVDVTVVVAVVFDDEQPVLLISRAADNIRMITDTIDFFIFYLASIIWENLVYHFSVFFSISFFIGSYHHEIYLGFSGFAIPFYPQEIGAELWIISTIICDTIWLLEELNANE
jgi:hypothetical protein